RRRRQHDAGVHAARSVHDEEHVRSRIRGRLAHVDFGIVRHGGDAAEHPEQGAHGEMANPDVEAEHDDTLGLSYHGVGRAVGTLTSAGTRTSSPDFTEYSTVRMSPGWPAMAVFKSARVTLVRFR